MMNITGATITILNLLEVRYIIIIITKNRKEADSEPSASTLSITDRYAW